MAKSGSKMKFEDLVWNLWGSPRFWAVITIMVAIKVWTDTDFISACIGLFSYIMFIWNEAITSRKKEA